MVNLGKIFILLNHESQKNILCETVIIVCTVSVPTFCWCCWCSKSCFWNCSRFCCCSCSASWWKRELLMGSDTMGLKVVSSSIRSVEVVDTVKWLSITIKLVLVCEKYLPDHKRHWTHSWDDEVSFLDSSPRSESFPKSKGPRSFCKN